MAWHNELYVIYKKSDSVTDKHKLFRLRTKHQLSHSQEIYIPFEYFRIVTKEKQAFVQITEQYYHFAKLLFDKFLTFTDEMKFKRSRLQTKELTDFHKPLQEKLQE